LPAPASNRTQLLLSHSLPVEHGEPDGRPQVPAPASNRVQVPPAHCELRLQALPAVSVATHCEPLQKKPVAQLASPVVSSEGQLVPQVLAVAQVA